MSITIGCAGPVAENRATREQAYRDLTWQAESNAWREAQAFYEKTGEVPFVGSEPLCESKEPPCIVEEAQFKGRRKFREQLFDSILRCEAGQIECQKVRGSERAMRKLAKRHWREARNEKSRIANEAQAIEEERLRAEEQAKLSEWREIETEERIAAEEAAAETERRAKAEVEVSAPAILPRDWEREAREIATRLASDRIGCSDGFGETMYVERVVALRSIDVMGPGDAARIGSIIDASHGAGAFNRMVSRAHERVREFIPRRCFAGF